MRLTVLDLDASGKRAVGLGSTSSRVVMLEMGAQDAEVTVLHFSHQGPMRRSTTLRSSSSAMRKMGETPMKRELRASEFRALWGVEGLSLSHGNILLKELGCS